MANVRNHKSKDKVKDDMEKFMKKFGIIQKVSVVDAKDKEGNATNCYSVYIRFTSFNSTEG